MTDKVAIVTAASKGMGAACARELARQGYRLAIMARSAVIHEVAATIPLRRARSVNEIAAADSIPTACEPLSTKWFVEGQRPPGSLALFYLCPEVGCPSEVACQGRFQMGGDGTGNIGKLNTAAVAFP